MASTPDRPTRASVGGTFVRVVVAGAVIAFAVGFPSFSAAAALSGPPGLGALAQATAHAALGAGITVLCMRTIVAEIWTAWVGLLSGVIPASLMAPPAQLMRFALAYLVAGAALVAGGLWLFGLGAAAASASWAFFGMTAILAGVGLGLGGAVPRLWWVRRPGGVEQPDDTIGRHLGLFAFVALTALSLSSGLAETLPGKLDPTHGVPLRRGDWEQSCVSTIAGVEDICPAERRYVLRTRRAEPMRLEWECSRDCIIAVEVEGTREEFTSRSAFAPLAVVPDRPVFVTISTADVEGAHYRLRARPDHGGGS